MIRRPTFLIAALAALSFMAPTHASTTSSLDLDLLFAPHVEDPAKVVARALVAEASTLSPDVAQRAVEAAWCAQDKGLKVEKILVVDMSVKASKKRLWAFDMKDPARPRLVHHDRVAHGSGSDPNATGRAQAFSNTVDSHQTSLGLYRVAEAYEGKHGLSRRLDGLFSRFNSNARNRAVVIHPSNYVTEARVGRSQGCPAVNYETMAKLEKAGLDRAVLWIDGPDQALGKEVASCADKRRQALLAQAREERARQVEERLKALHTHDGQWAVLGGLPSTDWAALTDPPTPMPQPQAPALECPACPLSRARFDCAADMAHIYLNYRTYA